MSVNYGVHASLHPNCHYQIIHASFMHYQFLTQERLYLLDFSNDEILKLIRSLNVQKAHGHDDIYIYIYIYIYYLIK